MRLRIFLPCLLTVFCLTGCEDAQERPPTVLLTIINAAPGFANLNVRRGSRQAADLGLAPFAGALAAGVDADTYNFTVETADSISERPILRTSFTANLAAEQNHLIVLTEQNRVVVPVIVANPVFDTGSANWQTTITHAAEEVGMADVYITAPGADLTAATPTATLGFGESTLAGPLQPGDFVVTVTEAGNVANVVFTSTTSTLAAGNSTHLAIVSDVNGISGVVSAVLVTNATTILRDVNAPASIRIINGAEDRLPRDIYIGSDFSTPFAAGIEFGTIMDPLDLPVETSVVSVTPAGDVSVIETEVMGLLRQGRTFNMLINGPAGSLSSTAAEDNRRPDNDNSRVLLMNAVNTYEILNVFVVDPGTDLEGVLPTWTISAPAITSREVFPAGTFEIIVKDAGTDTEVMEPLSVTLEQSGVYSIALIDSGDGTSVSALLLDDFQ